MDGASEPLVVGAGPTGLAAALFLSRHGVRPRIVDRAAEPSAHSKAFGINPRTLDLLESTGVTEAMLSEGRRLTRVNVWRNGKRLFRGDLSGAEHRFPFMLLLPQSRSEALLAEAVQRAGIEIEWSTECRDVSTSGGVAAVTLESRGRQETVLPAAVLAADGAHSTVRKRLRVGFPGSSFPEPWRLYDLTLDVPLDDDEGHVLLLDGGALFVIRLEGSLWRVIGNAPSPLDHLPPGSSVGSIAWESDFGLSHRVVDRLLVGTVAFAGDAAHLHSPLGARGMNLGIEDAYVFARLLGDGRLQDYERVRRPPVERVVRVVERLTQVPRGRTPWARAARPLAPLLAPLLQIGFPRLRRWVLGLDHEVVLR